MPIILQEKESVKNINLDPNNVKQLQQRVLAFDDIWKKNDGVRKDIPGVQQAKHVVGTDYNTENEQKKPGQISKLEAERIINHNKTDKNGKSVFHQLFNGDIMADIKGKIRQLRTQQKPSLPQKDNNKTSTQVPTPGVKEVKPVKANSAISESFSNGIKKIYLNESQLNILKEYSNQLILPFENDGNKMNYEQFVDWLEDGGEYGQLPAFQGNIKDFINNYAEQAYNLYCNDVSDIETDFDEFIYELLNDKEEIYSLFDDISPKEIDEYLAQNRYSYWNLYEYLNQHGYQELEEFKFNKFMDEISNLETELNINDRNLIFVERAITVPQLKGQYGSPNYFYNNLHANYDFHVGNFWSWKAGDTYCGAYYEKNQATLYLRGYVDPQSIDWADTLMKQVYSLKDEREIFINYDEPIEIIEILTHDGKRLPLRGSIIVKA